MTLTSITLFSDGSCWPSGTAGGAAAILIREDGRELEVVSPVPAPTTHNRMELFAVLIGLAALDGPHEVTVKTDSEYVRVNFNEQLPTWRGNGWRLKDRKPVLNRDLWEELAASPHQLTFERVCGHSGDPHNDRCDVLAGKARATAEVWRRPSSASE